MTITDMLPGCDQSPIESPSTADRTAPAIEFAGVQVFVGRHGETVTGMVIFPRPVGGDLSEAERLRREGKRYTGRTECPIDYRSRRPGPPDVASAPRGGRSEPLASARADNRHVERLAIANAYLDICDADPDTPKVVHARHLAGEAKVSVRSIQLWARKLETQGEQALRDRCVKPPRKVPIFCPEHAKDALLVCAWWAFRIGNCQTIDTKMMAAAVALIRHGYDVADLLATIDCYYSYDCNRERYPFKPFGRWARYELDKWVHRAADQADYRRSVAEGRREQIPLREPLTRTVDDLGRTMTASTTRQRRARNPRLRADIASVASAPCGGRTEQPSAISAISAVKGPQSIAESLQALEESWRLMLLRAAGRDGDLTTTEARHQALATWALWWPQMPTGVTGPIDMVIDDWCERHKLDPDGDPRHLEVANKRRWLMFLPKLRDESGTHHLHPARRALR